MDKIQGEILNLIYKLDFWRFGLGYVEKLPALDSKKDYILQVYQNVHLLTLRQHDSY